MCNDTREDEDCELVFVQDNAECDEDYYDECEDTDAKITVRWIVTGEGEKRLTQR